MAYGTEFGFIPSAEDRFIMERADTLAWEAEKYPHTAFMALMWIENAQVHILKKNKEYKVYQYLEKANLRAMSVWKPDVARTVRIIRALCDFGMDKLALPPSPMDSAMNEANLPAIAA